ncbi:MAG: pilus assembly PilX N-terminal domain-containing protein [Candidatus Methylomirabilales bacterium]
MTLLLMLGTAFLTISSTETQIAWNERNGIQAFYLAEAGVERVIAELNVDETYAGTGGAEPSMGPGTYTTTVTPIIPPPPGSFDRKQVASFGYVPSSSAASRAMASVEVFVERGSQFTRALLGRDEVEIDSGAQTDSFDSTNGLYGGLNVGSDGHVGSNGIIEVDNGATVHGDATAGGTVENEGTITGTITNSAPEVTLDLVDASYQVPNSNTTGITVSGGEGGYDETTHKLEVGKDATVTLAEGTYYFSEVKLDQSVQMILGGKVTIYLTGKFKADKNVSVNPNGPPTNLAIYSSGTEEIELDQSANFWGAIYAPDAEIDIDQDASLYGAAIGREIEVDSEARVHYDLALAGQSSPNGKFRPVAATWREIVPSP